MEMEEKKYIAFISYRHLPLDKSIAKKIHGLVEHYNIPKDIAQNYGSKKIGKVFRDEEELPASDNLTEQIQYALDRSEYLLVICSPGTPESVWVEREIEYFLSHHDRKKMIAVLVDGSPEESFPKLLTTVYDEDGGILSRVEPLAANLTDGSHRYAKNNLKREIVRIYAALLNVPFDQLWQRERRYRNRRRLIIASAVGLLLLAFSIYTGVKNRQISERNRQIEKQNAEIEQQYSELDKSRAEAVLRESELLTEKGDLQNAVKRILELTDTDEHRDKYDVGIAKQLFSALSAGQYRNYLRTTAVIEQDYTIWQLLLSKDTKYVYSCDDANKISCFSTFDGREIWKKRMDDYCYMHLLDNKRILFIYNTYGDIEAIQMENGEKIWEIADVNLSDWFDVDLLCFSEDENLVALVTHSFEEDQILILRSEDGKIVNSLDISELFSDDNMGYNSCGCAVFSEDSRYIAADIGYEHQAVLFDLEEKSIVKLGEERERRDVIGIEFNCYGDSVFIIDYDKSDDKLCFQEYYLDGREGNTTTIDQSVNFMELNGKMGFVKKELDGACIVVGVEDTAYIFMGDHGEFIEKGNWTGSEVIDLNLFDTKLSKLYLYNDARTGFFRNENRSVEIGGRFSEKIHFYKFAISDNYASYSDGESDYRFNSDAVAAVVCDEDMQKIYILRPAMDPNAEEPKWGNDINLSEIRSDGLIASGDSNMIYYRKDNNDSYLVKYINNSDGSTESTYSFGEELLGEDAIFDIETDGVFWPGADKYSFMEFGKPRILDLKNKKWEYVFGEETYCSDSICSLDNSGEVIHIALIDDESSENQKNLYIRVGDGEVNLLSKTAIRNYIKWTMQLGNNGWLICPTCIEYEEEFSTTLEQDDYNLATEIKDKAQGQIGSYYLTNIKNTDEHSIIPVCNNAKTDKTELGNLLPVFAVIETDNMIRVYDIEQESVKCEINPDCEAEDVNALCFCKEDQILAVCTKEKKLLIFDAVSGAKLHEERLSFDTDRNSLSVKIVEDKENNRYCLRFSTGDMIFLDADSYECVMTYSNTLLYSPDTQKVYGKSCEEDMYLAYPAYTTDELIKWAEDYVTNEE